jgi:excisionase family DNA binding protein
MECIATGAVSSRTKLYELIARGELHSFREGKRRLITAASLEQYVRRKALEAAA